MSKMNKKHLVYPLLVVSTLLFASCNENVEDSSSSLIESTTTSNPTITSTPTNVSTTSGSSLSTHYFDPTRDPYQVTEEEYNELVKPQTYTHHLNESNYTIEIMHEATAASANFKDIDPTKTNAHYLTYFDHGKVSDIGHFIGAEEYDYHYYFYFGENYLHSTSDNYLDDEYTYNFKNGDDVSIKTTKPKSEEDNDLLWDFFSFYDFRDIPFSSLHYYVGTNSYMAMEVDGDSKMECVKFMFFEGRLTKVICTFPNNLDKFQMNIYDYDTTVVNLPEGFPS